MQARSLLVPTGLAALSICSLALAGPGSLDPTFGGAGIAATPPGVSVNTLIVQPDGKIVVAGGNADFAFVLARFNIDGSLDAGFGVAGIARATSAGGGPAAALVLQPDGKLVAAAASSSGSPSPSIMIARFDAHGAVDPSFGSLGTVTTQIPSDSQGGQPTAITGMVLQSDAKIVVGASSYESSYVLMRYLANGSLDTAFGNAGIVNEPQGPAAGRNISYGPLLQSDGRLVVFGTARTPNGLDGVPATVRFQSNGDLDTSFGTAGIALIGSAACCIIDVTHATSQSDGRMLVAGIQLGGVRSGEQWKFWLARLHADGSVDSTFGTNGMVVSAIGTDRLPNAHFQTWYGGGTTVAVAPGGRILQTGSAYDGFGFVFALMRYNPDGSLDATFGNGGMVLGPPGTGGGQTNAMSYDAARLYVGGGGIGPVVNPVTARFVLAATPGTFTLSSNANPAMPGQGITLTAAITGQTLTGSVSFLDSGNPITGCQNVPLSGPMSTSANALCTTSTLTEGIHSIVAGYSGNSSNSPNMSESLIQRTGESTTTDVIEFFNAVYGDYFITSDASEIVKLDLGSIPGWQRTGQSFPVFAAESARTKTLCRFFSGQAYAPKSSHFFALSEGECFSPQGSWIYEGNVMPVLLPAPDGSCPNATLPVYRLYDGSKDGIPRHRYTANDELRSTLIAQNWVGEGAGPGVIGCVPM